MSPEPRPEVQRIPPAVHGAFDFAELDHLGIAPETVLDFSVNGNPYGPSPRVREAIAHVPLDRYPDREALALRRVLAAQLHVPLEQLLVGNGSSELLWLLVLAFLRPEDRVMLVGPTFGAYARAVAVMGAHLEQYTARPEEGFRVNTAAVAQVLRHLQPRLVFICNPNNPTGTLLPPETIVAWAVACPQTLVVVDEAYLPFAAHSPSLVAHLTPNMLVLHSMTKAHALAGLRLGYAVGPPDIIAALTRVRPPWSVNALAQAAGIAALQDTTHVASCLAQIARAKQDLVTGMVTLGLHPVPSTTHFFLLPVTHGATLRRALLRHDILVRDCASFGLPTYVRLATRRPEDNARLLAALKAEMG
jgi:histidinol-phosphate aminotransferase